MTTQNNEAPANSSTQKITRGTKRSGFSIRTLSDIQEPAAEVNDPYCLFKAQWLRKGGCGLIISSAGVGKSSFTMQAAVHWGKGEAMLGICPTRPLKSLVVQAEDDDYDICLFRRGTRIGLATELNWDSSTIKDAESNVLVVTISGVTNNDFFDALEGALQETQPDLVIINPLHAFFDGNLNESHACSEFLRKGLDPIIKDRKTMCGALIVHHTGKPKETSGNFAAAYMGNGSAELTNYPRSILTIRPHNNIPGVFDLIGAKHGDRLNWEDSRGRHTRSKVICYADKLPRYADKGRVVYWVEPTPAELRSFSSPQNGTSGDTAHACEKTSSKQKKENDKGAEENALLLVRYVETNPSKTITNQSLRAYSAQQWPTQAARKAVKQFEAIRSSHGIGKEGKCYTHSKSIA